MKTQITIDDLKKWDCCYSDKQLDKIYGNRKCFTPLQCARKRSIPVEDRIWVLLRPEILGEKGLNDVLDQIIDPIVKKYCLNCGVEPVENWARDWLDRTNRTQEAAREAEAAAWAAERKRQLKIMTKFLIQKKQGIHQNSSTDPHKVGFQKRRTD